MSKNDATTCSHTVTRPGDDVDLVAVVGTWAPPAPGRVLHLVVIDRCPHCGLPAAHYSGAARLFGRTLVRKCPRTGRPYLVLVDAEQVAA